MVLYKVRIWHYVNLCIIIFLKCLRICYLAYIFITLLKCDSYLIYVYCVPSITIVYIVQW